MQKFEVKISNLNYRSITASIINRSTTQLIIQR